MIQVNRFNVSKLGGSDIRADESEFEYQVRWIDGANYYRRQVGAELWTFCTDKEFAENVSPHNLVKWHSQEDLIPGGIADQMSPFDFNPDDLMRGIQVEMEHTSDVEIAKEIAMDHLAEDPEYYEKLKNIHN
jgi:hypothetical protein